MIKRVTINEPFVAQAKHTSVTCTTDRIEHTFDDRELGEGPARALARVIADGIREIAVAADRATIERRARARAGVARGVRSDVERYGTKPPAPGATRLFNASGRLAELAVRFASSAWEIVAPGDRLDGETFGASDFQRMVTRLRELVPALRAPLEQREVRAAISKTLADIVKVVRR